MGYNCPQCRGKIGDAVKIPDGTYCADDPPVDPCYTFSGDRVYWSRGDIHGEGTFVLEKENNRNAIIIKSRNGSEGKMNYEMRRNNLIIDGEVYNFSPISNHHIEFVTQRSNSTTVANNSSPQQTVETKPAFSVRLLTEADIRGKSRAELRIMRNEIFARHGHIFQSQDLRDHFSAMDWYNPRFNDVTHLLNDIERQNVAFIQRHE